METKTRDFLRGVSLFSGLDDHDLDAIVAHAPIRASRKNTVILEKGDDKSSLYVVISGRIKVYISDGESREIVLNECGPGEHFGEMALLTDLPRTASATTVEASRLLVLSKSEFLKCLSRHPEVSVNLIRFLVERLSALTDNMSDLALLDIYVRVKQILHKHAVVQEGVQVVEHFSQQDIANRVGSSRAMISRVFKDLKSGDISPCRANGSPSIRIFRPNGDSLSNAPQGPLLRNAIRGQRPLGLQRQHCGPIASPDGWIFPFPRRLNAFSHHSETLPHFHRESGSCVSHLQSLSVLC